MLTPQQCAAKVAQQKRNRLAGAMGRVEAGRQEAMAMQEVVAALSKRLHAMLVDLTYDMRLLDEAARMMDEEPTERLPRLPSQRNRTN